MSQRVNVPGLGVVEFPDGMSKEDMSAAIGRTLAAKSGAAVGDAVRGVADKAPVDLANETTRVLSSANEEWIAPALGGISDMVGNAVYAPINALFGTDYKADLTGVLREGMRDVGASGGPGYKPLTETGQVASDVVGGAAAVLPLLATGGAAAPSMQQGLAKNVMALLGSEPKAQLAAGAGAGVGSYLADEVAPDSTFAQLVGTLAGALGGAGIAATAKPDAVMNAFKRQKVPATAGLTAGDNAAGKALTAMEAGPIGTSIGGAGIVRNAYDRAVQATGQGVDDIARTLGTVQPADDLGATLQASVARFMDDKADEAARAFDEIGRVFGPDDVFVPTRSLQTLAKSFDNIDDPALQAITRDPRFQKYASAFLDESGAAKQLSYGTLKGFRSYIGRQMDRLTLDGGADNAQLKALYSALTDDMERALQAKGGDKLVQAFKSTNDWYRRQMETARANLQPLVGKGQPVNTERAFATFMKSTDAKAGNIKRLNDIYKNLTPGERADFSASIIANMGQGKDGFSVARFLTDLSKMSDDAKDILFRQQFSDDLLQAWDDLTNVIMPKIAGAERFVNRSNSGLSAVGGAQLLGAGAIGMAEPITAVTTLLGPALAAKMMTNPTAVRLLARGIARGEVASSIAARVTAILTGQQQGAR